MFGGHDRKWQESLIKESSRFLAPCKWALQNGSVTEALVALIVVGNEMPQKWIRCEEITVSRINFHAGEISM
jgi:hypothetical protein